MTIISKMKEKLKKIKIFSTANDYKNNYLLPLSKEKTNIDEMDIESIIRETEGIETLKDTEKTDGNKRKNNTETYSSNEINQ
ncbi:MAG TPA: hypothetical protein VKA98_01925 [Nitrososphaeraceae archaeon]|nr:hypothetical protein [Nitrososphaeraceae archaeon]